MKIFIYGMIFYFLFVFSSCGNVDKPSSSHVFNGIFKTETGIKFELKEDSTTFIQFNDSIHYKGVWAIHRNDENTEYVTIEFAGNPNYYYLKDSQLYHSEREMINNNVIFFHLLHHIKRLRRSLRQTLVDYRSVDLCLIACVQQCIF